MPKKQKTSSVFTRCNEYKDIFRVDDNVLFCNYCNISIDWKRKSTVDNHCKSQKHVIDVRSQKESQNKTQQLTLLCTQAVSESKKQLIEDQTFLLKKIIPSTTFTAYIETYRNSNDFGFFLENLINSLQFNTHKSYFIFWAAFEAAYVKFAAHIPNHPAQPLFYAYDLLQEWRIYCKLDNEFLSEMELD
ncbi:20732_t:CDS:2 [Rhizophagus irregularis]|nr:20732_t:CDS:2 [Rhizophagus irregularis]